MEYQEEDYLLLSGIQHFVFCRRQWALIHIEQQWEENVRTFEGRVMHENAHNADFHEKRNGVIMVRAMKVFSREMGISGECDVVEFHPAPEGITLAGQKGTYIAVPVEYKRNAAYGAGNVSGRDAYDQNSKGLFVLWRNETQNGSAVYRGIETECTVLF